MTSLQKMLSVAIRKGSTNWVKKKLSSQAYFILACFEKTGFELSIHAEIKPFQPRDDIIKLIFNYPNYCANNKNCLFLTISLKSMTNISD